MTAIRRPLDLPDLDAVEREARSLHETGYTQTGQWDLSQVCKHIAVTLNGAVNGFDFAPPGIFKFFIKLMGMIKRMFRIRRIRAGLAAPADVVFESANGDRDTEADAVEALSAAIERYKQARGRYHLNPAFGRLTDDEWDQFQTIHAMHHLSFLIPNTVSAAHEAVVAEVMA